MAGTVVHTLNQLGTSQPIQAIESPAANALFQNGTITVTGYAADLAAQTGTGVSLVHIFVNGVDAGPATYGLYHPGAAAQIQAGALAPNFLYVGYSKTLALPPGRFTLTVWAQSLVSGTPNSASVYPVDVNAAPSVTITAPASGTLIQAGQVVTMTASASDPDAGDGVNRVEWLANGGVIGQATNPPYALSPAGVAGEYSLVARAFDNRGGVRDSAASALSVNAPPAVTITGPPSGSTVTLGAPLTFTASASDPESNPITVTYLLNGNPVSPAFGSPYTWATTASAPGTFSISARAVDARGGQTVSVPITLTIVAPTSVVITSPAPGSTYAVGQPLTVAAAASDPHGVARVEFTFNGGTPLGTVTAAPYQIPLPGGAPAGTYTIVARMVDVLGNPLDSVPVTFYVTGFEVRAAPPPDTAAPAGGPDGAPPFAPDSSPRQRSLPATAWLALRQIAHDGVRRGRRRLRGRAATWVLPDLLRRTLLAIVVLLVLAAPAGAQETLEFYHLDPTGSVRMTTNAAGTVTARYDYSVFGEEPTLGGQPRKFAGKERDAETGYDYFGGRYYTAPIGRFTTVDPAYVFDETVVDPQRWNRYTYVRNNPLKYTDPDGRILETLWDVANVGMGVWSLGGNVLAGHWAAAAVDASGVVLDAMAAATPFIPGGAGTAIKGARVADKAADVARSGATEVVQRWMSNAELAATQSFGLVRGGRDGVHYVTDAANTSAQRARQRLALRGTPEVRAALEVPAGSFGSPNAVAPRYGMPGGGTERTATGAVPARVVKVDGKR